MERRRLRVWDPGRLSARQTFYLRVWLVGCFPVGLLLYAAYHEPGNSEGRYVRRWVNVCAECGAREAPEGTGLCAHEPGCPHHRADAVSGRDLRQGPRADTASSADGGGPDGR